LVVVNIVYGLAILVLLLGSFVAEDFVIGALGVTPAVDREAMVRGMRLIAVIGIVGVPLTHVILDRLLGVVDTVRAGDPFIIANATR
jgi:hypothetical protein